MREHGHRDLPAPGVAAEDLVVVEAGLVRRLEALLATLPEDGTEPVGWARYLLVRRAVTGRPVEQAGPLRAVAALRRFHAWSGACAARAGGQRCRVACASADRNLGGWPR